MLIPILLKHVLSRLRFTSADDQHLIHLCLDVEELSQIRRLTLTERSLLLRDFAIPFHEVEVHS